MRQTRVFDALIKFASDIVMMPIPVRQERVGYVLNSLLVPFLNAAVDLAAGGYADPHDVDKVWRIATGAPMGRFQVYDIIGLNTPYNILSHGDERERSLAAWLKENYIDKASSASPRAKASTVTHPPTSPNDNKGVRHAL